MGSIQAHSLLLTSNRQGARSATRHGFTLVEMLVTLAIVSILLAVGVPSLTQFLADQAAASNANEFAESLRFARTEAMKRGSQVTMCATSNPTDDLPTCAGKNAWAEGWVVLANGQTQVLRVQNALRSMNTTTPVDTTLFQVVFESTGIATAGDGSYAFNPVGDMDADGYSKRVRTVNVNKQGRVLVTQGS